MPATTCPRCGAPRPSLAEACPRCLLHLGLFDTAAARPGARAAPTSEELARRFSGLEILEPIGQGGMGVVYKARQRKLDRLVALKLLAPELADDPAFAERFLREARTLARLDHPHIVAVHDFGETDGLCWLLMEHVDGVDLRRALDAGSFTPEQALRIVPQICSALEAAHALGVVHRDIKPENILLDRAGRAKIVDFGLAKLVAQDGAAGLTAVEQVMGTPHYMAPEQLRGARDVDHRADIYSLGVVFYEMLTGDLPLGRFEPPSRRVQVDVRLDDIVLRALEREPLRRYQSALEVRTDVERVASGAPRSPAPAPAPAAAPASGSRPLAKLLGVLLSAGLVLWPASAGLLWSFGPLGALGAAALLWALAATAFAAGHESLGRWREVGGLSGARRFDRDAGALLCGLLGTAALLLALVAAWERGTPNYAAPAPLAVSWPDAARARLARLPELAGAPLPELAPPAVQAHASNREPTDWSPALLALAGAGLLAAAALLALRGRSHGGARGLLEGVAGAWLLVGGPTWIALVLTLRPLSDRVQTGLAGSRWLEADAGAAAAALQEALEAEGFEVERLRRERWHARADLAPLADHAVLRMEPRSLFTRWRTGDDGLRRWRPTLELAVTSSVSSAPRALLTWNAGLLAADAPERRLWEPWLEGVLRRAEQALQEPR